jgi:hypothetical protein
MKLLHLASALLATAAITHAQLIAIALIEFAIEVIEAETAVAALVELETSIQITAEVGEEVVFSAQTLSEAGWAEGVEFAPTDVTLADINPVQLNVVDEMVQGSLQWSQNIQVFGETVPVRFVTDVTGDVTVTADGFVSVAAQGELDLHGATITLARRGLTGRFVPDVSTVTFSVP